MYNFSGCQMEATMKRFYLLNGMFHLIAADAYTIISIERQVFDIHSMLAIAMWGIGICYFMHSLK